MADHPTAAVEDALRELAASIDVAPAEGLSAGVVARLQQGFDAPVGRFPGRLLSVGRVAAAIVLVVVCTLAVSPGARASVERWIGLRGVGGVRVTRGIPVPPPQTTVVPPPRSPSPTYLYGLGITGLGPSVTLSEAGKEVGFPMLLPHLSDLNTPDHVYVGHPPAAGEAVLLYGHRAGRPPSTVAGVDLLLAEFRGQIEGGFFAKVLPPDAHMETVVVNGQPGYWIAGGLHEFFYQDDQGNVDQATVRMAGNTLLWNRGGITLRLESSMDKQGALAVATSVR